ncbi:unnamed protein product [Arctogadus glacialis]
MGAKLKRRQGSLALWFPASHGATGLMLHPCRLLALGGSGVAADPPGPLFLLPMERTACPDDRATAAPGLEC